MTRPAIFAVVLLVCWAIGSTIIGRSPTAIAPDPSDGQLFAYFGLQWIHGDIPYVNIWDNKPPGIFAVNALGFLLSSKSFIVLAWIEAIVILGCIGTIYLLLRLWGAPWLVAALGAASTAVVSNLLYYNQRGNYTEIYTLWPAAVSMYCFSKAHPTFQGKWLLLAGFFSGVAALFKPPGLSPMLAQAAFMVLLWAVFRRLPGPRLPGAGLTMSVGALLAWLPAGVYFWRYNAFGELIYAAWTFNLYYGAASQTTVLSTAFNALFRLQLLSSLMASACIGVLFYIQLMTTRHTREQGDRRGTVPCFWWPLALLWVAFDLAGALAGGRYYPHYFLPLAASLSVLSGVAYWLLVESIPHQEGWWGVDKAIFGLIIGPLIFAQALDVRQMRSLAQGTRERPGVKAQETIATYLNTIRNPSETLFTWDYLPRTYLLTAMKSPMRLLDAHYIFDSDQAHKRFAEEIIGGLKQTPPTFIVDGWRRADRERRGMGDAVYGEFQEFLKTHYSLIYTAENLKLYSHQSRPKIVRDETVPP